MNAGERPLGLTSSETTTRPRAWSSARPGGAAINCCAMQGALTSMGFGGVGNSGTGRHHGIEGVPRVFQPARGVRARHGRRDRRLLSPPAGACRMRAAVFRKIGRPLTIEDVAVATPGPREVLIRTVAAGVCHSDLSIVEGKMPAPFPAVLGQRIRRHRRGGRRGRAPREGRRSRRHLHVRFPPGIARIASRATPRSARRPRSIANAACRLGWCPRTARCAASTRRRGLSRPTPSRRRSTRAPASLSGPDMPSTAR
ncbi:alcohol dehydrogenase catalytic domain-containing protein [Sphingomonas sp. MMS24-JH45]